MGRIRSLEVPSVYGGLYSVGRRGRETFTPDRMWSDSRVRGAAQLGTLIGGQGLKPSVIQQELEATQLCAHDQ